MISPFRTQPNRTNKRTKKALNTNFDNNSHRDHDLERPQLTSSDIVNLKQIQNLIRETKIFQKLDPCMRILKLRNTI